MADLKRKNVRARPKAALHSFTKHERPRAVVGIGASAGGLEAFKQFFSVMPPDSGLAFLLIPHLDPTHKSLMVELLRRCSTMPVSEATDGHRVQPNQVYIIPPSRYMAIRGGILKLSNPTEPRGLERAIDFSLRSLAVDQAERSIGIILSGTGSHGTPGIKEIKLAGGMAMVQIPESADYDQMPQSAIATGLVDYVLPPQEMAAALVHYAQQPYLVKGFASKDPLEGAVQPLTAILATLRTRTDYDFGCFRKKMVMRRVQRRMGLCRLDDMVAYASYLREHPNEIHALYKDLLIGVTSFFREPEAFHVLQEQAILPLVTSVRAANRPLRVWVPACATGEEAYSIAMLLAESFSSGDAADTQIFATDVDDDVLQVARRGVYPVSVAIDISPQRLRHNLVKVDDGHYRVNNALRKSIVFAPQNLISDPPFSRFDLISCRNLLIYFEPDVQRKLITLFHFALNPDGFLLLGSAESIGRPADMFETVSKKWRIYRRIGPVRRELLGLPIFGKLAGQSHAKPPPWAPRPTVRFADILRTVVLEDVAPASLLINGRYEILSVLGPVSNYLDFPPGALTKDLLTIARSGLQTKLRALCVQALRTRETVTDAGARVKRDATWARCAVTVRPVADSLEARDLLVITLVDRLDSVSAVCDPETETRSDTESPLVQQLEQELKVTRQELQNTLEETDSSNEARKASQEEMMSMNEELQSANEELESSKEELQSLNEELNTVNYELQDKVKELEEANSDMRNLLISADVATLFLDTDLRIKRFTPAVATLLNVIPADLGRFVGDFASRGATEDLILDCQRVIASLKPIARELETADGSFYSRRARPYLRPDDNIEGVVVTFVDVSDAKHAESGLRQARDTLSKRAADLQAANRALEDGLAERRAAQAAREKLIHRLFTVQEEERRVISRELHDRSAQHLTALALELNKIRTIVVQTGASPTVMDSALKITEELDRQIHDVAMELRPTTLDDLSLETALSTYVEEWAALHHIPVDFHGDGGEFEDLAPVVKGALYRILQEALTNVIRHAQATHVSVILEQRLQRLQMVIEDNGVGFETATAWKTADDGRELGITGMRERAAIVGGQLEIESVPGTGTTVFVRLPRPGHGVGGDG